MQRVVRAFPRARRDAAELIERAYLAASQPDLWRALLLDLVELTDSHAARLVLVETAGSAVLASLQVSADDSPGQDSVGPAVAWNPWNAGQGPRNGRRYAACLLAAEEGESTLRGAPACDPAAGFRTDIPDMPTGGHGRAVHLLLERGPAQSPYSVAEVEAVEVLLPHFRRALRIGRAVAAQQAEAEALAVAATRRPLPFFLLGDHGLVRRLSPAARHSSNASIAARSSINPAGSLISYSRLIRLK